MIKMKKSEKSKGKKEKVLLLKPKMKKVGGILHLNKCNNSIFFIVVIILKVLFLT